MDDETKSVADYKIIENGFIVMMTVKAKPVKPAATEDAKMEEPVAQPGVTLPAQAEPAASSNPQPPVATQPPVAQP